ncbi:hypothetical protein H0H93_017000, partial [Arthromyces matolae]
MSFTTTSDRYTRTPVRYNSSRSPSPVKRTTAPSTPGRAHVDILPQSPPLITSPILESNLCFTPKQSHPPPPPRPPMSSHTTPTKSRDASRKLRSPRAPSLSFPGTGDSGVNSPSPDPYRGRLVRSPRSARRRPSATTEAGFSSTTYASDNNGEAQQAMKKVEDIVERSWGARDLDDEG